MMKRVLLWSAWFVFSLVLAPLLPGIINRVKAFFAGRKGPSLFQLYRDLAKLLKKECIVSRSSGGVLPWAPCISLVFLAAAGLFIPYGGLASPATFTGDIVLFFYLLGTARMATVLGAMDTGSSFEGMGASREMQFSALIEAAAFAVVGFLALLTHRTEMSMLTIAHFNDTVHATSVMFAACAFFIILLCENSRVPIDDPETHLELTMIHEAMVLDYAGPDLAMVLYGASLKLWFSASFFVLLLMPRLPAAQSAVVYFAGVFVSAALVGIVESCMARYRFLKVPQMLLGSLGAALLGVLYLVFFEGGY